MSAIVLTELVLDIEETRLDEETAPVFKMADIVQLYQVENGSAGSQDTHKCTLHTT